MKPNSELESLQVLKLLQCVQQNDRGFIEKLCEKGVDGVLNYAELKTDKTALIRAIELNNEKLVRRLLELGADPEVADGSGKTAVMYACELGLHVIVEVLCNSGIDLNRIDTSGSTALSYCLSSETKRHMRCMEILLDKKADVNLDRGGENGTVFFEACKKNRELLALLMLKRGANADVRDKETNNHALHFAAQNNMLNVCYTLLLNQIDPNVVNFEHQSPLIFAAKNGHLRIVKLLFALGANFELVDAFGYNAIFYAVSRKSALLAKYLASRGTDPNYKNAKNKLTPMRLARKVKFRFAKRLFKKLKLLRDDWLARYVSSSEQSNSQLFSVDSFREMLYWMLRIYDFIDVKKERLKNLLREYTSVQNFIHKDRLTSVFRKYMSSEIPERVFEELFKILKLNGESMIEISAILNPRGIMKTLDIKWKAKRKKKKNKRKLKVHVIRGKTKVRIAIPVNNANANFFQRIRLQAYREEQPLSGLSDDSNWHSDTCEVKTVEFANLINSGNLESLKDLIERQKDKKKLINLKDKYFKSPLTIAVIKNDLRMVDYLLQNDADANSTDNFKWTPIHHAAFNGNMQIVSKLISRGANVNARTISGSSALTMAIKTNNEKMTNHLLKHKAKLIDPSNVNKESPLQIAHTFASGTSLYKIIEKNSKNVKKTLKPIVRKRLKFSNKNTTTLLEVKTRKHTLKRPKPDCARIRLPLQMPKPPSTETLLDIAEANRAIHGWEYDFPDYKTPFQKNCERIGAKKNKHYFKIYSS